MQSLKFSFLVFFFFQIFLGNLEKDNRRRRRSGFLSLFTSFLKIFAETLRRIIGGVGVDMRSLKFSIFVFFFFLDILWFVWLFEETWRRITGGE